MDRKHVFGGEGRFRESVALCSVQGETGFFQQV